MSREKIITFNGNKYGLSGNYYTLYNYGRKGVPTTLHRAIWESVHGPIPPDHHVHHKDEDTFNNDIQNLECIPSAEHLSMHSRASGWVGSAENLAQLASVNHLAKAWHKTEAGHQHHVSNGHKAWENRVLYGKTCAFCKAKFETPYPNKTKFCSDNCRSRSKPVKQEERSCICCGAKFSCHAYGPTKTCSKQCSNIFAVQRRREKNDGKY